MRPVQAGVFGRHMRVAAGLAGLLLTTEVMIAEAPKDEADHAHGAPGGMAQVLNEYVSWTFVGLRVHAIASTTGRTLRPSFSALTRELEPSRRPTVTSTPESRRFSACAWPWLP